VTEAVELMTEFGYHHQRLKRLGRGEVVAVSNDFSQLGGLAGIEARLQHTLRSWAGFYSINSHLVRREIPALGPETSLLQCAIADGDASEITASAERWLESVGSDVRWFRALRRSRDPRRACTRTLEGHKGYIQTVALAADRRRALSGCSDRLVKVWDLDSGQCLHTLEGHEGPVEAVAFLSGDRLAISTCYRGAKIWDLDTGRCVRTLAGFSGGISPLPGSTSRFLLGRSRGGFELWDVDAADSLRSFSDYYCACDIAVSGDGSRAATTTTGYATIDIWEVGTGERIRTLKGHTHHVTASAISSDGTRVLSASQDRTLKLWDTDTGQCVRTLLGHLGGVNAVALSSDGRCAVSASSDKTIRVWDVGTGRCVRVLEGHGDWVNDVVLSRDGRYALSGAGSPGGKDCTVRLWNLDATPSTDAPERHNGQVQAVAVSAVSHLVVSGSWDKTMKVWDVETGACRGTLLGHTDHVYEIMLLPDGRRAISQCLDRKTRVWDLESGCCVQENAGYWSPSAVTPDRARLISASNDNTLKVWELSTERCLRTLTGHTSFVHCVSVAKSGDRAVSGSGNTRAGVGKSDTTVRVWDLDTGQCLHVFAGHSLEVAAVAFSEDGRCVISGGDDPTVRVWDLDTGLCSHTLEGHPGVRRVALSSDGRCAFSVDRDGVLKIWTLETGCCERTLTIGVPGRFADGCVLTKLDDAIALWDLEAGSCLATWQPGQQVWGYDFDDDLVAVGTAAGDVLWAKLEPPGQLRPPATVAVWHPSGPIVAVVREKGTILLQFWHPESQHLEEIARSAPTTTPIASLRFSLDGTRLQVLSPDGTERILDATSLQPAAPQTCAWAPPRLTSPDSAWRAEIVDGRLKIVAAAQGRA
jgi:WD40 repeat protein